MKNILYLLLLLAVLFSSCHHDTVADRAERDARNYTERYCPTPFTDNQRTDSVVFDKATETMSYYILIQGRADDPDIFAQAKDKLRAMVLASLNNNTALRAYKEAGFSFRYVFQSASTKKVFCDFTFTRKQYQ